MQKICKLAEIGTNSVLPDQILEMMIRDKDLFLNGLIIDNQREVALWNIRTRFKMEVNQNLQNRQK